VNTDPYSSFYEAGAYRRHIFLSKKLVNTGPYSPFYEAGEFRPIFSFL